MKNFAAKDFEIVSEKYDKEGVSADIRATKADDHAQITNLITDGYLVFDSDHDDGKVFLKYTNSDSISFDSNPLTQESELTLVYNHEKNGQGVMKKVASINVLEGFAKAMNAVIPEAQQRAVEGMEKRYGVKAPTNG